MLKTLLKAVGLLACVVWFNLASAANMGGINVTSALGHPLKAEILLADMGSSDTSTLVARLASVNEFKNAGLDYPYSLPKLTFAIETRANGETYIKLTSTQPVNEPFVSLLVELSWPSGKMLREFTFLLDPAGFVAEQPKVAEVKPVEPVLPVPEPVPAVVPVPVPAVAPEVAALPVESAPGTALPVEESSKEELAESKPAMSDMAKAELAAAELPKAEPVPVEPVKAEPVKAEPSAPAQQAAVSPKSVVVEKGDTLGKLADEVKPVDVSLERMLVAMYRANAKSFDGKNMNRIKAGKILRMPEADEISKVSQVAAVKEIRAQVADWQNYRQQLAAAQSAAAEQAPKQEAAGKISAAVAEKTPVIKESAKEVLKLSRGESLGDKTVVGGGAKSKQEKLAEKEDDTAAKSKQLQEEQKKIAKLEGINKDVSKLVELKGGVVAAASAPAAAARRVLPAASAVPATQLESTDFDILAMLNDYFGFLLDDPVLLGAGIAVLLGLGGLGFVMARRGKAGQKKSSSKTEEVGATTGSWRTPVAPSPDTGDFTQTFAPAAEPVAPMSVAAALDDVDPISEADLFLNFGRDAQAEEILKDALSKNPSNNLVKLKLLSIYTSRKDSKTFSKYAQEVKDSGDAAAWERVAVMGREIDPENPTYGGSKGEVRHREPTKPEVDFDLGMDKPAAAADSNAFAAKDFKMDFDLTGSQPAISEDSIDLNVPFAQSSGAAQAKPADVDATSILSKEVVKSAQASSPMDFDVSGILPGEAKQIAQSTAMDFDISGMLPEETKKEEAKQSAEPGTMDFDLSGSGYESTAVLQEPLVDNEPSPSALNFNDLVFEIPTSQSKPVEEKPEAAADEGMAFTIDFPTSENEEAPSAKPAPKLDMDFGDININFGDDLPPANAGGEGKDEQWHEVATKLDLAKAYQEMGDADGAREILEEVMRDGDATQRESAEKLLQQIAA